MGLAYMSPERVRGEPYGFASDVWSIGLIGLEAALGVYPYAGAKNVFDQGRMIVEDPLPTDRADVQRALPHDLLELIGACLSKVAHMRPDAAAVTRAAFFARHLSNPVD